MYALPLHKHICFYLDYVINLCHSKSWGLTTQILVFFPQQNYNHLLPSKLNVLNHKDSFTMPDKCKTYETVITIRILAANVKLSMMQKCRVIQQLHNSWMVMLIEYRCTINQSDFFFSKKRNVSQYRGTKKTGYQTIYISYMHSMERSMCTEGAAENNVFLVLTGCEVVTSI